MKTCIPPCARGCPRWQTAAWGALPAPCPDCVPTSADGRRRRSGAAVPQLGVLGRLLGTLVSASLSTTI